MSEDILNKEEALQRRLERERKRQSVRLHKRIALISSLMLLLLALQYF